MVNLENDWDMLLEAEFSKDYYQKLRKFLKAEYKKHTVYPNMYDIFNALKYTSYKDTKVVLLGQDPYHGPGQANGLCFSVKPQVPMPPSLVNIFTEIKNDLGKPIPPNGDLTRWAKQGVLLLNTVLTVRAGEANSHKNMGWETFTDKIIELLNQREIPIVFMLWGANAKEKIKLLTNKKHKVLTAAHPSPLAAYKGFFGCKHFSSANNFLKELGIQEIDW